MPIHFLHADVMYRAYGKGHEQDPNWDGSIMHAASTVPGPDGIGGPYTDQAVVLRPDNNSQYGTFRLNFHCFDRFERSARAYTAVGRCLLLFAL